MVNAMQAVSDARRALVLDQPFFGVLSLKLELKERLDVKTFATDGKGLFFNPAYVASLTKHEIVGVVAHEVLHCANGHVWRRETRDSKVWNQACDLAINPIVLDAGMVLPKGVLDGSAFKGKSAEEIYALLQNEPPNPQGKPDQDASGSGQGSSQSSASGNQPTQSGPNQPNANGQGQPQEERPDGSECGEVLDAPEQSSPELAAEWSASVLSAAKRAEGSGRLPKGMERLVEDIKNPPQDWRAILRRFVQQNAMSDYSWRQPNSRYMYAGLYMPALRSERMPPLVCVIDTSGSIDNVTITQFAKEIESISAEMQPEKIHVVYCDNRIHGVDVFEPGDPIVLKPKGFGGTDFRPAFEWVEQEGLQPACLVYLTDLLGRFPPEAPSYPVLWGSTSHRHIQPPWGETVEIRC